jgi:hypothetical protein
MVFFVMLPLLIFVNMLMIYFLSWLTEKFLIRHLLDDPMVGLAVSILAGFLILLVLMGLIGGFSLGSTVLLLIAALIDWALRFRRRKQQKVDPSIFE